MQRLRELSRKILGAGGMGELLQEIIDVAVESLGADQGTLQLFDGTSHRIVTHRGHQTPLLKFFESAETVTSACWEAAKRGERVVVPDVEKSELFAGTPSLSVLRTAGVRAVQSTPMVSRSGKTVGILSTHWSMPHSPDERDLMQLDLLVRQAADLIEMARAEEALRASAAAVLFYESAPLMMGVVEIPADNSDIIHIYDSPATDRFFGSPRGGTVGQSSLAMGVPKETVRGWIENYRLAESQGRPAHFEYLHQHEAGAVWLSAVVRKLGPGDSGRTRFSYAVADVTERKQVEEALRTSEERMTLATLGGNLGTWDLDIKRNRADLSAKYYEMTGYQRGEIQPTVEFLRGLVHPDDLPTVKNTAVAHLRGESDYLFTEYRMRRKTGDYRWVRSVGKVVARDEQGKATRMAGVIADITVHKKTEEVLCGQLAHASRVFTMGMLASSISHELNQPLGAILNNGYAAELLLGQATPLNEKLREILGEIRNEAHRAAEVIQGMKTLLLKKEVDCQPLKINFLVEEILRFLKEDIVARKIKITTELSPQLPTVLGNRAQLQQVILNFFMNAMDAMVQQPAGRRNLTVTTTITTDGGVEVSVSDSGPGVEPGNLPRLFEPFFSTKQSGLGIGLWVAEKIVIAHNGRIWAENRPAGGATFHFVLPSDAAHWPTAEAPPRR